MKYRFYVNVEKDAEGRLLGFFGYQPGQALELAYTGEVATPIMLKACEILFEQFNINHPADYRNRSMSVGDVIVFAGNAAFACDPIGFSQIELPAMPEFPAPEDMETCFLNAQKLHKQELNTRMDLQTALGNLLQWAAGNRGNKDRPYAIPEVKDALKALARSKGWSEERVKSSYYDAADEYQTAPKEGETR